MQRRRLLFIQLGVVVASLGIVAATALPRFVDLNADARQARLLGAASAMKSASAITHATALARNTSSGTLAMEGQEIYLFNYYPTAQVEGIIVAARVSPSDGYTISGGAAGPDQTITVQVAGATVPADCQVRYTSPAATAAGAPFFTVTTSGC